MACLPCTAVDSIRAFSTVYCTGVRVARCSCSRVWRGFWHICCMSSSCRRDWMRRRRQWWAGWWADSISLFRSGVDKYNLKNRVYLYARVRRCGPCGGRYRENLRGATLLLPLCSRNPKDELLIRMWIKSQFLSALLQKSTKQKTSNISSLNCV